MAALTKDRDTPRRAGVDFALPVAAGVRIFTGAIVCLNAQGFAVPASESTALKFPSLALYSADNRDGVDGEIMIPASREVVGLDFASDVTAATVGLPVYLADDHTVTAAATGRTKAGLLVSLSDGQAWVDLTA